MDVNSLIAAIRKRSLIWDKSHKMYADWNATDQYWKEIAQEMNSDEVQVRKKWKYLRDKFSVEYGKWSMQIQNSGKEGYPPSNWHYFQHLMFLKDIVTPRTPSLPYKSFLSVTPVETDQTDEDLSNLQTMQLQQSDQENANHLSDQRHKLLEEVGEQGWKHEEDPDDSFTQPVHRTTKRKRSRKNFYKKRQLDSEEQNMSYLYNYHYNTPYKNSNHEDTDLMFFKTLLPHVALIPLHKKLEFQSQLQTIVQNYACYSGQDATCLAPNSTELNSTCGTHRSSSTAVSQSYSLQMNRRST